jgi:hypothetical protein
MDSPEIEKHTPAYEREDRVDLPPSEVEKRKLLYELDDELRKLFKRRFWIITIIVAIAGVVGVPWAISTFVQRTVEQVAGVPLKAIEKNMMQAELLTDRAKKDASDAMGAAAEAKSQVEALKGKAAGVEKEFGLVTERINAEAKNAALRSTQDFKANQDRIARLETLVKQIGDENEATRKAYADYKKEIDRITAETDRNQKRFAENSQYSVLINYYSSEQRPLAQQVQNVLANVGFKAALLPLFSSAVPGATDPATGEPWKGNSLTYSPESEMKAQEILPLIKPIIKDVRLRLREPPKMPSIPGRPPLPPPPEIYRNQFSIILGS